MKIKLCYAVGCVFIFFSLYGNDSDLPFQMIPAVSGGEMRRAKMEPYVIARRQKDRLFYTASQLQALEDMYQVANIRSKTPEAKRNLIKIVNNPEWSRANRMGCALLYLATMPEEDPELVENYLLKAIREYPDSWYGDGVQVGAYGRYLLAWHYWKRYRKEEAKALFDELLSLFPDAIGHAGELLSTKIPG